MKTKKNIKQNFFFNSIYQLSNIIVPLVTLPYLTRTIGAKGLGKYSFAYSVAYYFTICVKLGLQNYGNRTIAYVKDDKEKLSRTFWEIYAFQLFFGVVLFFIYLVYAFAFAPEKTLGLIMTILVLSSLIDVTWCLYGLEKFKVTSLRDITTKIVTMLCIFTFVKNADDVWKYALIFSVGMLINQIVVLPVLRREISFCRVDRAGVIRHIMPNIVLFIPVIAISIYRTMDKIMLGVLSSNDELGYYHAAENVIRVPMAFVTALGTVMLPRMSNMLSMGSSKKELERIFDTSISFAMFISSAVCLGIMTVAHEFVPMFYGAGFDKCIYLFYIILPGSMFEAFANVIRTQYLIPRKKDKIYILSLIMGASINLILNFILIPRYNSIGAAFGTLAAYAMVCIVQAICVFKEANIGRNLLNSFPYVVSGIIMFIIFNSYIVSIDNPIIALAVKVLISGALYMSALGLILVTARGLKKMKDQKEKES